MGSSTFRTTLLQAAVVACSLAACRAAPHAPNSSTAANSVHTRGAVERVVALGSMRQAELQKLAAEFPGDINVANDAELFRIEYWTELKGHATLASGLLSLPSNAASSRGVVMYMHGTNFSRELSPSSPNRADGNQETAVFAGNGYTVLLPDYIGLGVSTEAQAYVVAKPQVDASVDLLRAAQVVVQERKWPWSPKLFLMGFSQGGQSVAALHRELERAPMAGVTLKGSVAIAGPYDLSLVLRTKLSPSEAMKPINIGYIGFAALAYATYYERALADVFADQYAKSLPTLYSGKLPIETVFAGLPDDARKYFTPALANAIATKQPTWLDAALAENQTYQWVPKAPMRLYFGTADEDVPAAATQAFYDYASSHGGHVTTHNVGPVDHMATSAAAYAPTLRWFDTLGNADN